MIESVTHLDEGDTLLLVALARRVTVGSVRRHERHQGDDTATAEEAGHFAHAPHGLRPVTRREAKVAVEASPNVVPIQILGMRSRGAAIAKVPTTTTTVTTKKDDADGGEEEERR